MSAFTSGPLANVPTASARGAVTGMLLRFISCGVLCLGAGCLWWMRAPTARIGIVNSLADMLVLLSGFIVGGVLWYIRDVRLRQRDPERINDERIIFSFIVFVLMPLAVLVLVGGVWIAALIVGA